MSLAIESPKGMSQRIILGSWLLFCITLWAVYTGNLVAFLTVFIEKLPFDTVDDLATKDTTGYTVGILGGSSYETWLQVKCPTVYNVYKNNNTINIVQLFNIIYVYKYNVKCNTFTS